MPSWKILWTNILRIEPSRTRFRNVGFVPNGIEAPKRSALNDVGFFDHGFIVCVCVGYLILSLRFGHSNKKIKDLRTRLLAKVLRFGLESLDSDERPLMWRSLYEHKERLNQQRLEILPE